MIFNLCFVLFFPALSCGQRQIVQKYTGKNITCKDKNKTLQPPNVLAPKSAVLDYRCTLKHASRLFTDMVERH